jgi:hypothetical protein
MASIELLKALRHKILAEMEKRAKQRGLDLGKDYRTILYERLDSMRARREALGTPYAPPTAAERADLESYLIETAQRHAPAVKS